MAQANGNNDLWASCSNVLKFDYSDSENGKAKEFNGKVELMYNRLDQPLHIKKPSKIFVNSMSDLFHEDVPFDFVDKVFLIIYSTPRHIYQILTKRPGRMLEYFSNSQIIKSYFNACGWKYKNVWLGVSVEDQKTADERIPILLQTPAAVRFVSIEPMLGAIDLTKWLSPCSYYCAHDEKDFDNWIEQNPDAEGYEYYMINHHPGKPEIHWIIVGGESGSRARPMHPDWVRSIRDQCQSAGIPFMFKQWGEWLPGERIEGDSTYRRCDNGEIYSTTRNYQRDNFGTHTDKNSGKLITLKIGKKNAGRMLDGQIHNEYPEVK